MSLLVLAGRGAAATTGGPILGWLFPPRFPSVWNILEYFGRSLNLSQSSLELLHPLAKKIMWEKKRNDSWDWDLWVSGASLSQENHKTGILEGMNILLLSPGWRLAKLAW